ncbi:Retrovirus-related Pol polyprotein from transposon TNT 1-94 [Vitis vinifera]|uniref:Retrovirus-related Pol polyprotein from transposon TNT 1-94 n=1 Tax=Vitis vinifera TaxID=29760 RepID=A0A438CT45_VITVI|nr:Retrovirus-related Pol polyprotein from transposon TNT 1-94 [Vitis vinifera]
MVHYQRLPEQVQLCYQGILLSTLFSLFLTWTDLDSGKTIGNAEECSGLYILKERHIHKNNLKWQRISSTRRDSSLKFMFDTPQQNGIAERKNRHLLEVARSLMFSMNVPKLFWGQAVLTAAYLINRMPSRGENSTQEYQFWDLESFSESPITTENHIPPESFNQPESIVDLWDKEHIQEETEKGALSQQTHEAEPGPNPSKLLRDTSSSEYSEAFKYPKWKAVVDEEVQALEKNGTWEITDLPRGKKPVGCKWIFTVKYKADGNVDRYKAQLVAKGFTQSYGIDYQETFAPVAKLNTVHVLLSLAANLDWSLHQLDVKNAFLNGDLEEEVYMDIPAGLETTSNFNKVYRLRKSLYGLKQSPRAWFERFTKVVKGYGSVQCQSDHTLFVKHFPEGKLAIIIVYVDDIILTGDHEEKIDLLKKLLTKEFEIKDLGNLKYFLGMEIARSKKYSSLTTQIRSGLIE